jgi:hypothetical protein
MSEPQTIILNPKEEEPIEEQASKKQKMEESTTTEDLAEEPATNEDLENGFYVKNFGKGSRVYALIEEARNLTISICNSHEVGLEAFECSTEEMSHFNDTTPLGLAANLKNMLENADKDLPLFDKILEKINKEKENETK